MRRILITGMSGVGKSTVIQELQRRGYEAVDLDQPGWSHYRLPDPDGPVAGNGEEWMWDEDRVSELLDREGDGDLFVSGCSSNQGRFYPRLDRVILLSTSWKVMSERLANRTNNDFGKDPAERAKIQAAKSEIEPLLRRGADVEIDAGRPLDEVIDEILAATT